MFVVSVYDLCDGDLIASKTYEGFAEALRGFSRAKHDWEEPVVDDLAIFSVMLYTGNGNIIEGF